MLKDSPQVRAGDCCSR